MNTVPVLLILCASALTAADPFPRVGEILINDRLAALGEPRLNDPILWSVSFSPDGSRLAIAFGEPEKYPQLLEVAQPSNARYLVVVETAHPETMVYWANVTQFANTNPGPFAELVWAPDGNSLAYVNVLIRVPGGEPCRIPGRFGGFLSAATSLITIPNPSSADAGPRDAPPPPTTFAVINSQCRLVEQWISDRPSPLHGISPDGHLLALLAFDYKHRSSGAYNLILVPPAIPNPSPLPHPPQAMWRPQPAEAVFQREFNLESGLKIRTERPQGRNVVFLNGGSVVCGLFAVSNLGNPWKIHLRCWDTQIGKQVRQSQPAWTSSVLQISAGGGRIAVDDSGVPGFRGSKPSPRQHAVWDFETNKLIAKWSPEVDPTVGTGLGRPLGFAISPDGRLMAEAGSGSVRLYRLP